MKRRTKAFISLMPLMFYGGYYFPKNSEVSLIAIAFLMGSLPTIVWSLLEREESVFDYDYMERHARISGEANQIKTQIEAIERDMGSMMTVSERENIERRLENVKEHADSITSKMGDSSTEQ